MMADDRVDLLGLTSEACLERARIVLSVGHGRAPEIWRAAQLDGVFEPEVHGLGAEACRAWREHFSFTPLALKEVINEADDRGPTTKLILTTQDGYDIEAVRFPFGAQQALCISSQVGCKMGCTFCETGRLGLLRNLTAGEMLAQVVACRVVLGAAPDRIVFMGMGEALDNVDAVIQALRVLADRRGFNVAQERLTVCTSGHVAGIARLAELGWKRLNLSISLNAADDALRDRIMPVNRKTPLADLQQALLAYRQRGNFQLGVNYCLLPGINDRDVDVDKIASFCQPLGRVLVNLIPYNPGNRPLTRAPDEAEIVTFIGRLRDAGLPVRRRITKGRDIMAACGQLGDVGQRGRRRQAQDLNNGGGNKAS